MTEPTKTEDRVDTTGERGTGRSEERGRHEFDVDHARLFKTVGYVEDPDWVPSPYDQFGTVHTAGTAGDDVMGNVQEVSTAFQRGRVHNLIHAARALDPEDPTPADNVVLPGRDHRDEDTAREEVFALARDAIANPTVLGETEARRRAAEGTAPEAEAAPEDEKTDVNDAGWVKQEG